MNVLIGILEEGLIYAILALGVLITYRVLDFPDLTVDSSFPLGAAVSAVLTVDSGTRPITLDRTEYRFLLPTTTAKP